VGHRHESRMQRLQPPAGRPQIGLHLVRLRRKELERHVYVAGTDLPALLHSSHHLLPTASTLDAKSTAPGSSSALSPRRPTHNDTASARLTPLCPACPHAAFGRRVTLSISQSPAAASHSSISPEANPCRT